VGDVERPTDRALHALAPLYTTCSAHANGRHNSPCPGADGRDHNLPPAQPDRQEVQA
jgi:hypothetical protein